VLSEKEFAQGYCDLFMSPKGNLANAKYSWLIELKYLPTKATDGAIAKAFATAEEQLERYSADKDLVPLLTKHHELKACTIVFIGAKEIRCRMWPKGSADDIVAPAKKGTAKKKRAALATKKPAAKKRG
jgi:PD-(D/E)XK nuclease superfamily